MGMGIKHGIGDGNGREWETTSMGMGITCTPWEFIHTDFFAAFNLLRY